MSNSSYYISEIEKHLSKLKINVDSCVEYNEIFSEVDDKKFTRKLRIFHNELLKRLDEINSDYRSK